MHVLVIGGGISGLAAAHRLLEGGARVTLLEASPRFGGKLRTGTVAGVTVDLGAESLLARRPEAVELARAAGLADALRVPRVTGGALWTRGAVRPMPRGHVMGVPGEPEAVASVVSPAGLSRIAEDERLPRTEVGADVAVGAYVAERLGHEVVDRLVEPLLGGVYAGDAYRISLRAAVPRLYEAARAERSLLAAVRALREEPTPGPEGGPVFMGIEGGVGRLPTAVAESCRAAGAELRTGVTVRALHRTPGGWSADTGEGAIAGDAVVLALPAPRAARLLSPWAPAAATELDAVEYASMALVTMAFARAELPSTPEGSGFLVPPVDGRSIKAATFSSVKWEWVEKSAPDLFVLRASLGRYGDEAVLEREDAELADLALADLAEATGLSARPVDTDVTRWYGGLPQYPVGHLDRVAGIRSAVAALPGLVLCGAVYDGVGVPACVGGGRRAAEDILAGTRPGSE
ncbi:protoporphyrinogen oxidase [Streptomyces sp. AJS327]|uniref:protoporphyrinogen oxidase n=1 Tax=Streptomyces sp. AJS327 TaxID=2545265 RepID=UPI0015DE11A5|nr:protoporphyrinogen oxidase [Streptomyces sp. AJS327]MBA0052059.1 protoporphyrinogen oxidase [Streptomyces sp. AJS327]